MDIQQIGHDFVRLVNTQIDRFFESGNAQEWLHRILAIVRVLITLLLTGLFIFIKNLIPVSNIQTIIFILFFYNIVGLILLLVPYVWPWLMNSEHFAILQIVVDTLLIVCLDVATYEVSPISMLLYFFPTLILANLFRFRGIAIYIVTIQLIAIIISILRLGTNIETFGQVFFVYLVPRFGFFSLLLFVYAAVYSRRRRLTERAINIFGMTPITELRANLRHIDLAIKQVINGAFAFLGCATTTVRIVQLNADAGKKELSLYYQYPKGETYPVPLDNQELLVVKAYHSQRIIYEPNLKDNQIHNKDYKNKHSQNAYLVAPLIGPDGVFGTISFAWQEKQTLSLDQRSFVRFLAKGVANALIIAHSIEKVRIAERHNFAMDLHDAVIQNAVSALMIAESLPIFLKKDSILWEKKFNIMIRFLKGSIAEARMLLNESRPDIFYDLTINQLLDQLVTANRARFEWDIIFVSEISNVTLEIDTQYNVYRIAQEALNNAVNHSQARQIEIRFRRRENDAMLELSISDNGIGFVLDTNKRDVGITHIKRRAGYIGGNITIDSSLGIGTSIIISWPSKKGQENNEQ